MKGIKFTYSLQNPYSFYFTVKFGPKVNQNRFSNVSKSQLRIESSLHRIISFDLDKAKIFNTKHWRTNPEPWI